MNIWYWIGMFLLFNVVYWVGYLVGRKRGVTYFADTIYRLDRDLAIYIKDRLDQIMDEKRKHLKDVMDRERDD